MKRTGTSCIPLRSVLIASLTYYFILLYFRSSEDTLMYYTTTGWMMWNWEVNKSIPEPRFLVLIQFCFGHKNKKNLVPAFYLQFLDFGYKKNFLFVSRQIKNILYFSLHFSYISTIFRFRVFG